MSATAPVYAFLAAAMLTLCAGFLTWWLAVVVASMARQLPWTQAWFKRLTARGSGGAASAGRHGAVRLLFTAPTSTTAVATASAVNAHVSDGTAVAAAAGGGVVHLSPHDVVRRDRPSGAGATVKASRGEGVTAAANVTKVEDVPIGADGQVTDINLKRRGHRSGDNVDSDFATVNPLRSKRVRVTRRAVRQSRVLWMRTVMWHHWQGVPRVVDSNGDSLG